MLKLIKLIICIQCFVLVKGVDLLAGFPNHAEPIGEQFNRIRVKDWENNYRDYLQNMPDHFVMEDKSIFPEIKSIFYSNNQLQYIREILYIKSHHINKRYIQNLSNQYIAEDTKCELFDLKPNIVRNHVKDLNILIYAGEGYFCDNGWLKAVAKAMIWNRFLLLKETFGGLLNNTLLAASKQKLLSAYTNLSKIQKKHIDALWANFPSGEDTSAEYEDWVIQQPQTRTIKFMNLIQNILLPLTDNVTLPEEYFNNYFDEADNQ